MSGRYAVAAIALACAACDTGSAAAPSEPGSTSSGVGRIRPRRGAAARRCPGIPAPARSHTMQCASLKVPLDYRNPGGRKITLALSRVPATAPASQRQGVLLVNPGGPGGSGLSLAACRGERPEPKRRRRLRHHRLRPARCRVEQAGAALRHVVLRRGDGPTTFRPPATTSRCLRRARRCTPPTARRATAGCCRT